MKFKNKIVVISFLLTAYFQLSTVLLFSQSIHPSVIACGGTHAVVGSTNVSYTIGEPIINTVSNNNTIVTQGFHQPNSKINSTLELSVSAHDASCSGANNAFGVVTVTGGRSPFIYVWKPFGGNNDTSAFLPPGTYTVTVTDSLGASAVKSITVKDGTSDCGIVFYSGITPNGDGDNDTWQIEKVDKFPVNTVSIFNRWGEQVWKAQNYNNLDVVWRGKDQQDKELLAGTYYYVIVLNSKTFTGWIELTR